jgi:hypothetical protein
VRVVINALLDGDGLERADGGGLIGRAHARLPRRDADADENPDNCDHDHQLDERKPAFICATF